MANPTSNFGWQMPTSTDLVTDLPADFETFGQAVDTSLADLKGGTTGQILSKASSTDMDFTWVAPSSADITGVSVTSPITGGGTSGDVTIGISSSAIVPSQTGNSGKYLTTDGTTSSWGTISAGGMTLLSTTTLSSTTTTISSISGSYKNLLVVGKNIYSSANDFYRIRFNSDTGSSYSYRTVGMAGGTIDAGSGVTTNIPVGSISSNTDWSNVAQFQMSLYRYTDTSRIDYMVDNASYNGSDKFGRIVWGRFNASAAVTSITVYMDGGASFSSGTIYIYGVS